MITNKPIYPCVYLAESAIRIDNLTTQQRIDLERDEKGHVLKFYPLAEYRDGAKKELPTAFANIVGRITKLQVIDHRSQI